MRRAYVSFLLILFVSCLTCARPSVAGEPIKLNFLERYTSPDRTAFVKDLVKTFEASHPNVTINVISPPFDQAEAKLNMMINAREPLDIVEISNLMIKQFVTNGVLENLEPRLASWPDAKTWLPLTFSAARFVDNTAYLMPQFYFIKALFMRTDVLKKLGVDTVPTTMQQLYDLSKQITKPAANQYGFAFRGKGNPFRTSDYMILADLPNVDPKNVYRTTDGRSVFEHPQFLKSLKAYIELFKTAVPPDGINWGFAEQVNAFASGVAPFLVQDPDTVALVDRQIGRDKYTVVPMPLGMSGRTYLDYGFAGLAIPSYSKNKDAAWDFIKQFSAPKQNAALCKMYGPLPTHAVTYKEDPYFSTGVYKAWAVEMNTPEKYTFVRFPTDSPVFPGWPQVQQQSMQAALLGQISPEDAAAKWASYWK